MHPRVAEPRQMTTWAAHLGAAMTGVESQQLLQQPSSQLDHGGADRQLHGGKTFRRGIAELVDG